MPMVRAEGETRIILDDMSRFFEGRLYPIKRYNELTTCLTKFGDQNLIEATDAAWVQFYDFYLADGLGNDTWGSRAAPYIETKNNKTAFFGKYPRLYEVQEKCNFASNVAYYRSAIRVCDYPKWRIPESLQDALMKVMLTQGTSSAWFHGSITNLGRQFDGYTVGISIYAAYQIAIRSIVNPKTSPELWTAGENLKPTPITKIANDVVYMAVNFDTSEWEDFLKTFQIVRGYSQTVVALVAYICATTAPFLLCRGLVAALAPALLNGRDTDFINNQYMPQLQDLVVVNNLPLPAWQGWPLLCKSMGLIITFLWAFVFQEERLPTPCLEGSFFNLTRLGAWQSPLVDMLAFAFHKVENTDPAKVVKQPYPGSPFCNKDSPHALWHQLSADSLVELYAVVDELDSVLRNRGKQQKNSNKQKRRSLLRQEQLMLNETISWPPWLEDPMGAL